MMAEIHNELKKSKESLYLDVLYRKYILVYYADVYSDSAEVLKLDHHSHVWEMANMKKGVRFAFEKHIHEFAERFLPSNKQDFINKLSREYISQQMKKASRYVFRFDSRPNLAGNMHYEVQVVRVNPDEFDGRVIIVSQEIDDVVELEKQHQEELDAERQYLDVLCWDYTAVYRVNLIHDTAETLKVEANTFVAKNPEFELRKEYPYTLQMRKYCEEYIAEMDRKEFLHVLSTDNLHKMLKTMPRFVYRYRGVPNPAGYIHFEAQAIRLTDDLSDGDILLGFRHIDDVVTEELRHQFELEELLETERVQNEVLTALGANYDAIFKINLEEDSYIKVSCCDEIQYYYSDEPSAFRMLQEVCERIVAEKHCERMQQFFDLKTLKRKLKDREFIETECITRNGTWHRSRLIAKRRDDMRNVTHALYVTQIINDEKQYEEHLIARAEYADWANQSKTSFISQVAHDIRTPMNSIFGFLEIAEANLDDREKLEYSLEKIRVAGEFLKSLVDDVLDVSRMEEGKTKLQPEELDLYRMLEEFSIFMEAAKHNKNHTFHVDIHNIIHNRIVVDPLRLKQIYTNVMSNAIKYTPDGGTIDLIVYQEEIPGSDKVRLVAIVRDNGMGMSEELMEKMFVKFQRGLDTRINKISGYGLGLSIVKQLVDLMGGTIDVQSKLGEGTTFGITLELPYVEGTDGEPDAETEVAATNEADMCRGMHLLVAEDNKLNQEVITELLNMHGMTCECVDDGNLCVEQIHQAEEGHYDAILMDMQMPNMSGVDATRMIRAMDLPWAKTIPIIALTANAMRDDVQKSLEAGMDRHLSKPVDMTLLMKTLAELKNR